MINLNGIATCPYCNSNRVELDWCEEYVGNGETKKYYWVVCNECDARSGRTNTIILAIAAWNRMSELWLKKT